MASLNLMQWREQSLWLRYRALHSFGILLLLVVTFLSAQWVMSYSGYLSNLKQQVAEQKRALESHKAQRQQWLAYQQKQKSQRVFMQHKRNDQLRLNAFYALLDKTHGNLRERELSLSHSQLKLTAQYQQIQHVNDHYAWVEKHLATPGLQQQLLPQLRVQFRYTGNRSEAAHRG